MEEEPEQLQRGQTISISSSPEINIPSLGTSPSLSKSQSSSDHSSSVTNAEVSFNCQSWWEMITYLNCEELKTDFID